MIYVVSGWIEHKYDNVPTSVWNPWTRFYRRHWGVRTQWRYTIAVFALEADRTKTPVWRKQFALNGETASSELYCEIQLDCRKKELQAKYILRSFDFPWLDGIHPNKAVDKGDIVTLFPECATMPRPYCLDYIRDRA